MIARFVILALMVDFSAAIGANGKDGGEQPNIIVILADDLGYNDVGFYEAKASPSPYLDRLADEGLLFTDFYAGGPVCSPTRASLLTGKFPSRLGLEGVYRVSANRQEGMAQEEVTLPEILRNAGYATGLIGKWHLGYLPEFSPINQGFDVFRGFLSGNIDYHSHVDGAGYPDWWSQLELVDEVGYATDLISRSALRFIEAQRGQPFFLLIAHGAPHFPFQGREDPAFRSPGQKNPSKGIEPAGEWPEIFGEMITALDEGVGKIVEVLDGLGIAENTLIIFFSDNGGLKEVSDHGPFRGWKSSLWEGGIRVPAFAYWKGRIAPGVTHEPVSSVDLFATFTHLAGVTPAVLDQQDGADISPLFNGAPFEPRTLLWRFRHQAAARRGPWKLLRDDEQALLFHLRRDPGESRDVSGVHPDVRNDLLNTIHAWEANLPPALTN